MNDWMLGSVRGRRLARAAFLGLWSVASLSHGQEVRRAEAVGSASPTPTVRRALPADPQLEPFDFDRPVATPIPRSTPPPTNTRVLPAERAQPVQVPTSTPRPRLPEATPAPAIPVPTPATAPATPVPRPSLAPTAPLPTPPGIAPGSTAGTPGEGTSVSPDRAQIEFANSLYSRKIYDLAAPEYERYLSNYENGQDRQTALYRLGECYRALGKAQQAKNSYDTLVSLFSSGPYIGAAAYRLADMYYQEKDYATALPLFRKASVRLQEPLAILSSRFYTARCLEALKLGAQARSMFEDVIAEKGKNPFREAARLSAAKLLIEQGRKEEAIVHLDALAKETEKPDVRAEALVKSGVLKVETDQPAKAEADFTTALAIPEIGEWKELAQVGQLQTLYATGKYQEVLDRFQPLSKTVSVERRPELLILAANSQRQLGKHAEARALYEEIAKAYPNSEYVNEARYQRLVSLYNANDPGVVEAADQFLANVQDPEKRDQITLLKAEALYKKEQFSAAAPVYAALESSTLPLKLKAEAQFKLGWCYVQTNQAERAVATFTDFIKENPAHKLIASAIAQRAVAQQRLKHYKEALADFDQLIRRYPKARERELALQQKALILGEQQANREMADTFRLLLKEYPKTPAAAQAQYWIGWAAFEAKDYAAAIEPLREARKADKEQFFERATLRLMLCHFYLEQPAPLAEEVEVYKKSGGTGEIPAEVLRWLGRQYYEKKEFGKAEDFLGMLAARAGASERDDIVLLARSQIDLGKYDEAVKTAQRCLNSSNEPAPKATANLLLSRAQIGLKDFDKAQQSAEQACLLQPEGRLNAEGRILLGDVAAARAQYEEAAKIFMSVSLVFDDPSITPQALEKAYHAYRKAGRGTEAESALNKLQSRYPEYPVKVERPL